MHYRHNCVDINEDFFHVYYRILNTQDSTLYFTFSWVYPEFFVFFCNFPWVQRKQVQLQWTPGNLHEPSTTAADPWHFNWNKHNCSEQFTWNKYNCSGPLAYQSNQILRALNSVDLVGLVRSYLHRSENFYCGYFVGSKYFLLVITRFSSFFVVGVTLVQFFSRGYFLGPNFFSWVFRGS